MSFFERLADYQPDCCTKCEGCGQKVCLDDLVSHDACYKCVGCNRVINKDHDPSPAEDSSVCSACFDIHGPEGTCSCCERRLTIPQQLEALTEALANPTPYDPANDPSVDRKCRTCAGSGQVVKHWNYKSGQHTMGRCLSCMGTGVAA